MENAWKVKTSPVTGFMHFALEDEGEVTAKFHMNPGDIRLVARCQAVSEYISDVHSRIPENATHEYVLQFNNELESKFSELLGYDAKENLFGNIPAVAIMPDGCMFVIHVMNAIIENVLPELQKRKSAQRSAVKKYTDRYKK